MTAIIKKITTVPMAPNIRAGLVLLLYFPSTGIPGFVDLRPLTCSGDSMFLEETVLFVFLVTVLFLLEAPGPFDFEKDPVLPFFFKDMCLEVVLGPWDLLPAFSLIG